MPSFDLTFLGNSLQNWLLAAGAAVAVFAVLMVLKLYLFRRLRRLAASTTTQIDDFFVGILTGTRTFAIIAAALYLATSFLSFPGNVEQILNRIFMVLLFLQGALWGIAAIGFARTRLEHRMEDEDPAAATAVKGLIFAARVVLWGVVSLLVLDNLGVNITGLIAGLGIGGIAVALALQNVLGDLFASLAIQLDKPFVGGDFVVVDSYLGTIERIGLKTTRLRSLSGEQIVISNTDLLGSRIRNFKRMTERRVVLALGVTYQTPVRLLVRAGEIIRSSITEEEGTRCDRVHFKEFGSSALEFEAVYFILSPDYNRYMDIQQAINLRILERFTAEGIEFAYPTQTLFVQGDRSPRIPREEG
jgi:small-conductance mechanosensitive channel